MWGWWGGVPAHPRRYIHPGAGSAASPGGGRGGPYIRGSAVGVGGGWWWSRLPPPPALLLGRTLGSGGAPFNCC